MKCAPENCPVLGYANMSPAVQREKREAKAKELYERGFTEAAIAAMFGVTQGTISNDLGDLLKVNNSKRAKSKTNPKGAGRLKGRRKDTDKQEKAIIAAEAKKNGQYKSNQEAARAHGVGETLVREAGEKLGIQDWLLSATAQQKLDAAIRAHQRKLDVAFERAVHDRVSAAVEHKYVVLNKRYDDYAVVLRARKGILTRQQYNTIIRAIHPDLTPSIEDRNTAMHLLNDRRVKIALMAETEFGVIEEGGN